MPLEPGRRYSGQDLIDMGMTTEVNTYELEVNGRSDAITVSVVEGSLTDAEERGIIAGIDAMVTELKRRRASASPAGEKGQQG